MELPAEGPAADETPSPEAAPSTPKTALKPIVKIYFATDRLPSGNHGPSKFFGKEWNKNGDHLVTGVLEVSIPPSHKEGKVERPLHIFTYELKENPEKHVVLTGLQVLPSNKFYEQMRGDFDALAPQKRSALVFIHGFNVTFDAAAYTTAQLAFDLHFDGVPMMYSWPSQGLLRAYDGDEEAANWSPPHLQSFLERVARESGAVRIHLIAHSMGNRVMTAALKEIGREPDIQPMFENVIMAAPDVNAYTFMDQLWPQVKKAARHFTLYASSDDKALVASRDAKGKADFTRLGEGGPHIFVIPGLDTIDASGIDTSLLGHSYVDTCAPVIKDLELLIEDGLAPLPRGLRDRQKQGLAYWAFPSN